MKAGLRSWRERGRFLCEWFVVECGLTLEDDARALAALSSISFSPAAFEMFAELGSRYRAANMDGVLRRFRAASRSSGKRQ